MSAQRIAMTAEDFDAFTMLPENAERLFEFIGGEVVEVPSNPYSSAIGMRIATDISVFVRQNNLGHVTGEAGGYMVAGERYAPDVAFVSKGRQAELPREGYNPIPPDLAVEVVSPGDSEKLLRIKIANYLAAGVVVWLFYPDSKEVEIYVPGEAVKVLDAEQTLDGGRVLPGFKLTLSDIFGS